MSKFGVVKLSKGEIYSLERVLTYWKGNILLKDIYAFEVPLALKKSQILMFEVPL